MHARNFRHEPRARRERIPLWAASNLLIGPRYNTWMDPERERFSPEPAEPAESAGNFSSGLLAVFLATSVGLGTVVVLSILTEGHFLPVLLIGAGIFFMVGFHYLVWGWWLTSTITAEELAEEEQFPGSPREGKE